MQTVKGYIKKVNKDNKKALVVLMNGKRCSECDFGYCEACDYSRRYERIADNSLEAEAGDTVNLECSNFNRVRVMLWLIPVVIAALTWLAVSQYGVTTSAVMAAVSLPASYAAVYIAVGKNTFFYKKLRVVGVLPQTADNKDNKN